MTASAYLTNRSATHATDRGFTLLEVMVALGIFAILSLASWKLLSQELDNQRRLQSHSESLNHWRRAMGRLTEDLQQVSERSIRLEYGERQAALVGDSDALTFTRRGWSNPLQLPRSDLQRVSYQLEWIDGQRWLTRHFWPQLDRAPGSEAVSQRLLPDIEQLQLRYFDTRQQRWLPQWDARQNANSALPQAIEITLHSVAMGEVSRVVTLRPGPVSAASSGSAP
ncbi:type II secretion system minor pseudopilin GspJ [Pseudomaricurvus sp. HS19]|uniref:type II secretion system minor pseudopilin GspJ n=1 Tax=Pseudomaricurvus sp. HS19 TaxID=2692626 RepID=UPI00136BA6C2|nr:type II secretion system minor pseudopilin GspJ [Pseudomaricurvus sp. HS19]MYM62970.1 type II secretion system minor pseudopilin GspJ [Pseudomaricurvus sp. HS19]